MKRVREFYTGQVKKYVGIIFEKHLKFAMLKTYILPKYYKSSTSDEHMIGRQHCNSEFTLVTHRAFGLTLLNVCRRLDVKQEVYI